MSKPDLFPKTSTAGIIVDPKTLERVIPESKRPDGTVRKQLKIRPGFTPQEDISKFRGTRQAQMDSNALPKGHIIGWTPPPKPSSTSSSTTAKSKSAKKNEKRKEKRKEKVVVEKVKDDWEDEDEDEVPTPAGEGKKVEITTGQSKDGVAAKSSGRNGDNSNTDELAEKLEKLDVR